MSTTISEVQSNETNKGESSKESLIERYGEVRNFTEKLTEPLETEDYVIQTMPDVSPAKWHLAHTSWFFEEFILSKYIKNYKKYNELYNYLFNSYYILAGDRHCRPKRGLISRPTVKEVYEYRSYINQQITDLLSRIEEKTLQTVAPVMHIGINHEQQHQELMVTDIKHVFSENPLDPVYYETSGQNKNTGKPYPFDWIDFPEGIHMIGNDGSRFGYDNEFPRHKTLINPFSLGSRLVNNREYIQFIEDGGYSNPGLWLSDGWDFINTNNIISPLYWYKKDGRWFYFTLTGCREVDHDQPVCHVSYYEADAFARWAGARLPSEFEWEAASSLSKEDGNFVEREYFHPVVNNGKEQKINQMYGDVWEWTGSSYLPYPGFQPLSGALGEYNGKFMCNQMVLRGGSCATSLTHIRNTYRNFFHPDARWQFSGIRLAKDGNS